MKHKATILIVDDSEGVARTLSLLLQESGYTAIPAYSAARAHTASTEVLERAKNAGIEFPALAKPIPPAELLSTLRSLLKKRTAASTVRENR